MSGSEESLTPYLQACATIDWQDPGVLRVAAALAQGKPKEAEIARACFEYVRDEIAHSLDAQQDPVTCRASDVLRHRTGYCYAKSHLLAALLRANRIPAALCYQRLSIDGGGPPYSLHGLVSAYLEGFGWHRIDPRGNKPGIDAQFDPPHERLAFALAYPGERDLAQRFAEPLPVVVSALGSAKTWQEVLATLPDWAP